MSMYKGFIKECTSWEVHEDLNYFYTFRVTKEIFFIKNLYIKPLYRGGKTFFKLKKHIYNNAFNLSAKYIAGEFHNENPFYNKWMSMITKMGFKIMNKENNTGEKYACIHIKDWS